MSRVVFVWLPGYFVKVQIDGRTTARAHRMHDGSWQSGGASPIVFGSEEEAIEAMKATYEHAIWARTLGATETEARS